MAERFLEFLSNLLKIGKQQLFLKSEIIRSKVPIKPVLGLTGLGVLFVAVKPLLSSTTQSKSNGEKSDDRSKIMKIAETIEPQIPVEYNVKRTVYLMKEKEKELKRQKEEARVAS